MRERFSDAITRWYAGNARDLPWRRPGTTPWGVLVSEIMLQQTPVSRVLPAYEAWIERWPDAASLAASPAGEAIRQWGTLGYPRRALRLHSAAVRIRDCHNGELPDSYDELFALPGVGAYTAAAVASFAFRQRHAVLDTNVRRVLARAICGMESQATSSVTKRERLLAESLLPQDAETAATYAVAVMEFGALVCTARAPCCTACPIQQSCGWHLAGRPDGQQSRRTQTYEGTDRQARGRLLAVLREAESSMPLSQVEAAVAGLVPDEAQRARALQALIADGLVRRVGHHLALP
jgi:A/G-specific adenine glycosylase